MKKIIFISIFFLARTVLLFSQNNSTVLALNDVLMKGDIDNKYFFENINSFNSVISGKKVIALGEATHGTKEFFVVKSELIKHLIEHLNYKVLVFESDFVGTRKMNNYILYGIGSLKDGLFGMGVGIYFTEEFIELIKWLRKYNLNKPDREKVKVYGCDMRFYKLYFKAIKEKLISLHLLNKELKHRFSVTDSLLNNYKPYQMAKQDKNFINDFLFELKQIYSTFKDSLPKQRFENHIPMILSQSMKYAFRKGGFSQSKLRNRFMAENCLWIYHYENKNNMIVWAHNEHIAKKSSQSRIPPMGYYLSQKLDRTYYTVGLAFNEGELRSYNSEKRKYVVNQIPPSFQKKSYDNVFSLCQSNNFFIDIKSASKNKTLASFFNRKYYSRSIGAVYYPEKEKNRNYRHHRLIKSYDAILFIKKTTSASSPVKQ